MRRYARGGQFWVIKNPFCWSILGYQNQVETEISTLEAENKTLKTRVSALKDDDFYKEKYAREEYGLAKSGEYIFQFKDDVR